jgi:hypothetical protein
MTRRRSFKGSVRGSMSKTRKGRKNYMTHKGDKYYHRRRHLVKGTPYIF